MGSNSFNLAESLLDSVYGLLEKAASEPLLQNRLDRRNGGLGVSNDARSIPTKQLVGQFIIDAFWATCRKEEERNLTFRIAPKSPSDAAGSFEFR